MRGFIVVTLLCTHGLFAQNAKSVLTNQADFRQIRWGFTPRQVKEAETTKPVSTKKESIVYSHIPLAGRMVGLEYEFNDQALLSGTYYYYTTAAVTENDVKEAAAEFEKRLNEKYGPDKTSLSGPIKSTIWLTPRTQINLVVGNVDRGWSVEIKYICRVCASNDSQPKPPATPSFVPGKEINDF